jgi:hypothetical protein
MPVISTPVPAAADSSPATPPALPTMEAVTAAASGLVSWSTVWILVVSTIFLLVVAAAWECFSQRFGARYVTARTDTLGQGCN